MIRPDWSAVGMRRLAVGTRRCEVKIGWWGTGLNSVIEVWYKREQR